MLVLSRRAGESIVIAGDIRIKVVKTGGNRVSLAIDAPPAIPIKREEIMEEEFSEKYLRESA